MLAEPRLGRAGNTEQQQRPIGRQCRHGDLDEALANAAHTVEETFQTQRIEHLFLEPESALAEPLPDGRQIVSYEEKHPKRAEVYTIRWDW